MAGSFLCVRALCSRLVTARTVVDKVLRDVVRNDRLLVVRHLDVPWEEVGRQVPAGIMEAGGTRPRADAVGEL